MRALAAAVKASGGMSPTTSVTSCSRRKRISTSARVFKRVVERRRPPDRLGLIEPQAVDLDDARVAFGGMPLEGSRRR